MEKSRILKIALLGAESTGKTELCQSLAKQLNTVWVPEFAREYFNHSDIYNYKLNDLNSIATKQVKLEQNLIQKANTILFCDTALITLKIWAELEFKHCPQTILQLMEVNPYDYYLVCNNEVPWEKDAQRQNKFSRELIMEMNIKEVEKSGVRYSMVTGLKNEREELALNHVRLFLKANESPFLF